MNARPLLYDYDRHASIDVIKKNPARLSYLLSDGKIDIGLVPVVEVFKYHYQVCPRVSLSSKGQCMSVRCFYRSRISNIKKVLVTKESHSSVALLKILFMNFYGMYPMIIPKFGLETMKPTDDTAILLIGDKCIKYSLDCKERFFDLSEVWHNWTGLPFVFALWASPKEINNDIQEFLVESKFKGLKQIDTIVNRYNGNIPKPVLYEYLHHQMNYHLGPDENKGMRLFRSYYMKLNEYEFKQG